MDNIEAIKLRHSVRDYSDKPVEGETLLELATIIDECNKVSGLHLQLVRNEPKAFDNYKEMLKSGGSDYPIEIVKKAGVDFTKMDAINGVVTRYAELLDELKKALNE